MASFDSVSTVPVSTLPSRCLGTFCNATPQQADYRLVNGLAIVFAAAATAVISSSVTPFVTNARAPQASTAQIAASIWNPIPAVQGRVPPAIVIPQQSYNNVQPVLYKVTPNAAGFLVRPITASPQLVDLTLQGQISGTAPPTLGPVPPSIFIGQQSYTDSPSGIYKPTPNAAGRVPSFQIGSPQSDPSQIKPVIVPTSITQTVIPNFAIKQFYGSPQADPSQLQQVNTGSVANAQGIVVPTEYQWGLHATSTYEQNTSRLVWPSVTNKAGYVIRSIAASPTDTSQLKASIFPPAATALVSAPRVTTLFGNLPQNPTQIQPSVFDPQAAAQGPTVPNESTFGLHANSIYELNSTRKIWLPSLAPPPVGKVPALAQAHLKDEPFAAYRTSQIFSPLPRAPTSGGVTPNEVIFGTHFAATYEIQAQQSRQIWEPVAQARQGFLVQYVWAEPQDSTDQIQPQFFGPDGFHAIPPALNFAPQEYQWGLHAANTYEQNTTRMVWEAVVTPPPFAAVKRFFVTNPQVDSVVIQPILAKTPPRASASGKLGNFIFAYQQVYTNPQPLFLTIKTRKTHHSVGGPIKGIFNSGTIDGTFQTVPSLYTKGTFSTRAIVGKFSASKVDSAFSQETFKGTFN